MTCNAEVSLWIIYENSLKKKAEKILLKDPMNNELTRMQSLLLPKSFFPINVIIFLHNRVTNAFLILMLKPTVMTMFLDR